MNETKTCSISQKLAFDQFLFVKQAFAFLVLLKLFTWRSKNVVKKCFIIKNLTISRYLWLIIYYINVFEANLLILSNNNNRNNNNNNSSSNNSNSNSNNNEKSEDNKKMNWVLVTTLSGNSRNFLCKFVRFFFTL